MNVIITLFCMISFTLGPVAILTNTMLLITIISADNLNGAQILGRTIRVDHVSNYKKKEEEDEELRQQKREERGVCRAFQRGECTRGDGCKFSHNEQVRSLFLDGFHCVFCLI